MLRILKFIAAKGGPVPARIVCEELGLPRSTVYHLLRIGIEEHFFIHFPEEQKYGLSHEVTELANNVASQEPVVRLARSLLSRMVDEAKESGHLSTLMGNETVYRVMERASGRPPIISTAGIRLPAHTTASGLAMLSVLSEDQLKALYTQHLRDGAGDAAGAEGSEGDGAGSGQKILLISDFDGLKEKLKQVREQGFSEEYSEVSPGMASISAAVRGRDGRPKAAMTLTFEETRLTPARREKYIDTVKRYAQLLEKRITR